MIPNWTELVRFGLSSILNWSVSISLPLLIGSVQFCQIDECRTVTDGNSPQGHGAWEFLLQAPPLSVPFDQEFGRTKTSILSSYVRQDESHGMIGQLWLMMTNKLIIGVNYVSWILWSVQILDCSGRHPNHFLRLQSKKSQEPCKFEIINSLMEPRIWCNYDTILFKWWY